MYIWVTGTSSSVTVQPAYSIISNCKRIKLIAYSIRGVPVTSGVPDSVFYNLSLSLSSYQSNMVRTDNMTGWPILLTGSTNVQTFSDPPTIGLLNDFFNNTFTVSFTIPTGGAATLTSFALLLEVQ